MIKKLKHRFIFISLASVALVMFLLLAGINLGHYGYVKNNNTNAITLIMNHTEEHKDDTPLDADTVFDLGIHRDIRFFTCTIKDGNYNFNAVRSFRFSETEATSMVDKVMNNKNSYGYMNNYRYKVNSSKDVLVFLDVNRNIKSCKAILYFSIFFYIVGLALVYLGLLILSKSVLKPVYETYNKQNRFISNSSHELKTPLTIISANTELIEMTEGKNAYTEGINKQIKKMDDMVRGLTMISKLHEEATLPVSSFSVSNLCNEIIQEYEPVLKEKNLFLNLNIQDDVIVKSDQRLVSQLITLIIDNASKYSTKTINLSLTKKKKAFVISESNESPHIQEGDLSFYLDRFYRNEQYRNKVEGNGIGLSLVNDITEYLEGSISVFGKDGMFNIEITIPTK